MEPKKIEKIEVAKNTGNFYYTGILKKDPADSDYVLIDTTRGEHLRFRKEQIMQQKVVNDTIGADTHGKREGNKNL